MGESVSWVDWFLSFKGNEFFCSVDDEFISDRFNLTGIGQDIPQFKKAYELITGSFDHEESNSEVRSVVEKSARHAYGLIHQRFILTTSGLEKMLEKYEQGIFGSCPRVLCNQTKLLPIGVSDLPNVDGVKLFCPDCEDIYNPKSGRHANIDGAYFGTTFAHMFIQTFPQVAPSSKSRQKYVPKIFGFRIADRSSKENCFDPNNSNSMII